MTERALYGLAPKALLTGVARELGYDLGCQHLLLVGAANRVVDAVRSPGETSADGDPDWIGLGAIRRLDGDYQLECCALSEPRLGHLDLKSALDLRRRHALCSEVHAAVSLHFQPSAAALLVA
jgi:hypothetical protein